MWVFFEISDQTCLFLNILKFVFKQLNVNSEWDVII
jgi:hypothetical protein